MFRARISHRTPGFNLSGLWSARGTRCYISLQVNDQTYYVDTYYAAQSNWYADEIDIAFQMDGNWEQQPYNVWLDNVTLNAQ